MKLAASPFSRRSEFGGGGDQGQGWAAHRGLSIVAGVAWQASDGVETRLAGLLFGGGAMCVLASVCMHYAYSHKVPAANQARGLVPTGWLCGGVQTPKRGWRPHDTSAQLAARSS